MKKYKLLFLSLLLIPLCFSTCKDEFSDSMGKKLPAENKDFRDDYAGFYKVKCTLKYARGASYDTKNNYIQLIKSTATNDMYLSNLYDNYTDANNYVNGAMTKVAVDGSSGNFTLSNVPIYLYNTENGAGSFSKSEIQYTYDLVDDYSGKYEGTCECSGEKVD